MKKLIGMATLALLLPMMISCSHGGGGGGGGGGVTYDNSRANGDYTYVAAGSGAGFGVEVGTMTFDGAGNGILSAITSSAAGSFTYTVTTDDTITINGTLIGTMRKGGDFFVAIDTTNGKETMITAIKKSTMVTDATNTYLLGQFSYETQSRANIILLELATPNPGEATATDLAPVSGPSGTVSYTFNADGTFSVPSSTPSLFGAVTSDHQLVIVGDAETIDSAEVAGGCGFKLPGSGMSTASLDGSYLLYEFMDDNVGSDAFVTIRARVTFDGNGSGMYSEIANSKGTLDPGGSFSYAVAPDGSFLIDGVMPGVVIQDGSVLSVIDYDDSDDSIAVMIGIKQ